MIILLFLLIVVTFINMYVLHNTNSYTENFSNESFIDNIDKCIYINLEKREDRKKQIEEEFKKLQIPDSKIHRIDAVYEKYNGHIGACKSHIKALEHAKEHKFKTVIIFEDDFVFTKELNEINNKINTFFQKFKNNWDIIFLHISHNELKDTEKMDDIKKILTSTGASAYIIQEHYYDSLLDVFKDALHHMEKEMKEFDQKNNNRKKKKFETSYALDQHWKTLQKKDKWYTFFPFLGKQNPLGSTIMGHIENFINNVRIYNIQI
jgi:glycosyl transferase family 25